MLAAMPAQASPGEKTPPGRLTFKLRPYRVNLPCTARSWAGAVDEPNENGWVGAEIFCERQRSCGFCCSGCALPACVLGQLHVGRVGAPSCPHRTAASLEAISAAAVTSAVVERERAWFVLMSHFL